ncbi:angiogenic factor with G patch and FHA domains 1 isoform X2 [Anopheles darlingi]|uniref:angiogenic factor with G patch and FHA domains 1 isoform X2 n=1 Tax=Anopheles darlingi TaxID=43151 RepID=UPI0021003179|nr:angiogenic factor with G patch and FHA domains 1 isoform X2 [Anopheles darlingi]
MARKPVPFRIFKITNLGEVTSNQLCNYVQGLHRHIQRQNLRIQKLKHKIKSLRIQRKRSLNLASAEPEVPEIVEEKEEQPLDIKAFVDDIKQTAQDVDLQNRYIYEPTSGLYYDPETGYYYNSIYGLHYDGQRGCYLKYNTATQEYDFYSQVIPETMLEEDDKAKKKVHNTSLHCSPTLEDSLVARFSSLEIDRMRRSALDVAKRYPPSLRIVVKETNLKELKIGSLFIVTCKGGSLGREGNHDVIIPDINISKSHLQFTYNDQKATYQFVDLGSKNGTLYNGVRVKLGENQAQSDPVVLLHGSILQLNQTKLLCHVHEGNATCGKCEPGLLVSTEPAEPPELSNKISKPVSHKEGLKLIQKRFGLENEKYVKTGENQGQGQRIGPEYKDRAATRRKVKGSSNEHEKTQMASLEQSIASDNKGFQMLSKLGWNEGKPLGRNDAGLTEPIPLKSNVGTSGLGSTGQLQYGSNVQPVDPKRHSIWRKTQERFERSAAFVAGSSEDSE